jgi:hypothetical protein
MAMTAAAFAAALRSPSGASPLALTESMLAQLALDTSAQPMSLDPNSIRGWSQGGMSFSLDDLMASASPFFTLGGLQIGGEELDGFLGLDGLEGMDLQQLHMALQGQQGQQQEQQQGQQQQQQQGQQGQQGQGQGHHQPGQQ